MRGALRTHRSHGPREEDAHLPREGVGHVWLVSPERKTLEVYRLENARYSLMDTFEGGEPVRADPFDSLPLELDASWRL